MHPPATYRQAILTASEVFGPLDDDLLKMRAIDH
jgi:hypothetical protein